MSSSMKKTAKAASRTHRERAQPASRQRLGLLEKHGDYKARARDYKQKQATLRNLRRKASERNEDEFAFGMMSRSGPNRRSRGVFAGTVAGDRGNKALSVETVRLLKTQDMQYIRTMRTVAAKEVRELGERVVLAGGEVEGGKDEDEDEDGSDDGAAPAGKTTTKAKKIVFLDDADERKQAVESQRAQQKVKAAAVADDDDVVRDRDERTENRRSLTTQLRKAREKLKALTDAERELDAQRARMAKTATYGGITKSGKKIKIRERKR